MENTLKLIAEKLAERGQLLSNIPNGIFHGLAHINGDDAYNNLITNLSNAVTNDVNRYKHSFIPVIKDYLGAVTSKLNTVKPDNIIDKYCVNELHIPGYIGNLKDKGIVGIVRDGRNLQLSTLAIPVPKDDSVINDYIKSGNPVTQTLVSEITDSYGIDGIIQVWEKHLTNISSTNKNIDSLYVNTLSKLKEISLLHILVTNIKENPLSTIKVSDDVLNTTLSSFLVDIENLMSRALKEYNDLDNINRLIYSVDEFTVTVHDKVYDRFLADHEEFDISILLGFILSGKKDYSSFYANDVVINADSYREAWNKLVKQSEINSVGEKVKLYKTIYSVVLSGFIDNLSDDVKEYTSDLTPLTADNRLKILLDSLEDTEILDISFTGSKIITNVVITEGNFNKFMDSVYTQLKETPSLSMGEAATLATIDVVADFVLGNTELTTIQ